MLQLVKTKRQANFKGFKRFGAFKGLVEQKNVVFNSFVCKLGPIYTQTRQIIAVWPDCGHGHTYPVHGWPFCGEFEIVPEKIGAGLRPIGEITMHLFI
jgi:hypothetical protein